MYHMLGWLRVSVLWADDCMCLGCMCCVAACLELSAGSGELKPLLV